MSIIAPFTLATDRGYKFLRVFDQYYIARGGRLLLRVEGGIAPYDWEITGSDFTLDEAQTAVQYNFIEADADVEIDVTATVTVTDANAETVTIVVCSCNISSTSCTTTLDSCSVSPLVELMECTSVVITAVGGCPPYYWEIATSVGDVELGSAYTNAPVNTVKCIDADCYTTGCEFTVTITDANDDEVTCGLGCSGGVTAVSFDQDESDDTIDSSTPATLVVVDGIGPYVWAKTGTGYTLTPSGSSSSKIATVTVVAGACGDEADYSPFCGITCTDACGNVATWSLRCTNGGVGTPGWSDTPIVGCPCGEQSDGSCVYVAPYWTCTKLWGKYKIVHVLELHSPGGATCAEVVNYPNAGDTVEEYCQHYCNLYGYAAYMPCLESSPTLSWGADGCSCAVWGGYARCTIPDSVRYWLWECS